MRPKPAGFTLIEVLTVVVIAAVLASLALPSFTTLIAITRAKGAASDLYLTLMKARSEAVKRNANVTISPNAGGWVAGWQILDASANVLDTYPAVKGVTIVPGGPGSIVYQSSGRIQGATGLTFDIAGTGSAQALRCVSTAVSGRPYIKNSPCP